MPSAIPPGRPGNLTPEQEETLRRFWQLILQVFAVAAEDDGTESTATERTETPRPETPKKKRLGLFSRKGKKDSDSGSSSPASTPKSPIFKDGEDDKYGQTKQFYETLASQTPESIRATFWGMVKHDHPDALALRFLRARKWDVEKALVMLVSTMNWRSKGMKVDDDILRNGEGAAAEAEKKGDANTKKLAQDFLAQARMGKSFVHGIDKQGRPLCIVRVRLHKQGELMEESLERYTVFLIETCRLLLTAPVDTATIVFDMTGFSMANMDYAPVKFMIKCFEANYPESLGVVLVHKAPWVFQGIWKIIRGWLDPVVANKIRFTNSVKDMEEHISPKRILKELDGEEDWEYKYVEPVPGENAKMDDGAARDRLLAARELLYKQYEEATLAWIKDSTGDKAAELKRTRNDLASRIRAEYWTLDPYVRARSYYDRTGVLKPGGLVDYYPAAGSVPHANGNGSTRKAVGEVADDDVD